MKYAYGDAARRLQARRTAAPAALESRASEGARAPSQERPRRRRPRPALAIIGGNGRGRVYRLDAGRHFCIGRALENEIVLADVTASRKHALLSVEQGWLVLRDMGSANGVVVNGQRIHSQPLREGDQIEIGSTLLRFTFASDAYADLRSHEAPPRYYPAADTHDLPPDEIDSQPVGRPAPRGARPQPQRRS